MATNRTGTHRNVMLPARVWKGEEVRSLMHLLDNAVPVRFLHDEVIFVTSLGSVGVCSNRAYWHIRKILDYRQDAYWMKQALIHLDWVARVAKMSFEYEDEEEDDFGLSPETWAKLKSAKLFED